MPSFRKSKINRTFQINLSNIKVFNSIFFFINAVVKSAFNKNSKYLLVSISPYTFLACIFLKLLGKTPITYLRSDGFAEYKLILGLIGKAIYYLMFTITSLASHLISCRKYILRGKKGDIVHPSQLDADWFNKIKEKTVDEIKLLYVGRIRKEKGIFSLLKLVKDKNDFKFTIVGAEKNFQNINQSNIFIHPNENNKRNLIKFYDDHEIFILPSFTEGYPMVLLESLARLRPAIIFEDIKHVVGDKKGVFVSKRKYETLLETISHIKNNYKTIQLEMKKNNLPTNKEFIKNMANIISNSN